jgi:putative transposase
MAHPARNACPDNVLSSARVFFVTTNTSMGRRLLQSERNATLLIDVLRSNVATGKFQLHDFVVMPDHLHLLMTLQGDVTIEKAMQLIKGGFSYRLKRELGYQGEIWQRGFSDVRIRDWQSFSQHRAYILQNPVKAGLVNSAEDCPYCYSYLAKKKAQGLKLSPLLSVYGPTKEAAEKVWIGRESKTSGAKESA